MGKFLGVDGKYHPQESFVGIDGQYNKKGEHRGVDGKYHPFSFFATVIF